MRRTLLLSALAFGWTAFRCSGGGNATIDAGPDVVNDVVVDYQKPETAPPTPTLVQLVAGAQHTCMLVSYGQQYVTYCFGIASALGATAQGMLAVPTNGTSATQPSLLSIATSHGAGHTCGIDTQHQVWCWGDNSAGQCGQGNTNTPVTAPQLSLDAYFGITQAKPGLIAAGTSTTCVVRPLDGKLECFGDNTSCESDMYDMTGCSQNPEISTLTTDTNVVFTNITMLSQGALHGCVAASPMTDAGLAGNASLFCYGDNASLESGPAGKAITTPAVNIAPPTSIVSLSTGDSHTCFVTNSPHQLYCFGKNDVHQSSPTSTTTPIDPTTITPIALPGSATPYTVGVRAAESCAVDTDGNMWCFGMGHGTNIDPVAGLKNVGEIAIGGSHTCVVANLPTDPANAPASVLCWGDNTNGQCGQPAGGMITTPTAVMIPPAAP